MRAIAAREDSAERRMPDPFSGMRCRVRWVERSVMRGGRGSLAAARRGGLGATGRRCFVARTRFGVPQSFLNTFCFFEVRSDFWPNFTEQSLELGVFGVRNQSRIEGFKNLLVSLYLRVHVGPVEVGSLERFELVQLLRRPGFQLGSQGVVGGDDVQLGQELLLLLLCLRVILNHHRCKLFDASVFCVVL